MFERWLSKTESNEKILDRVDLGNDVSLVRKMINGEEQIVIAKAYEEVFDLITLAPAGTKIKYTGEWFATVLKGNCEITIDRLRNIGDLATLLHEIGHLQNPEDADIKTGIEKRVFLEQEKDKLVNLFPESRLEAIREQLIFITRMEYDAWAYAILQMEELEQKFGIQIFGQFLIKE